MKTTGIHKGYATSESLEKHLGYWDDLRFPITAIQLGGAQPPSATVYKGGLILDFPTNADKTIYFTAQLPHGVVQGVDLDLHYHMALPTSGLGAGAENIKIDITYSWAGIGGVFPAPTTVSTTTDVQNIVQDTHTLVELGPILYSNRGTGADGVSDCILFSFTRDVGVASDYTHSMYLVTTDMHLKSYMPGSREEYVQ